MESGKTQSIIYDLVFSRNWNSNPDLLSLISLIQDNSLEYSLADISTDERLVFEIIVDILGKNQSLAVAIEKLVNNVDLLDFDVFRGTLAEYENGISISSAKSSGGGAADWKNWEINLPRIDPENLDSDYNFKWNHTVTKFEKAKEDAGFSADYEGLTDIWIYQFDTGWGNHPKLDKDNNYLTNQSFATLGKGVSFDNQDAQDSLNRHGFPAKQKPGHGVSTAHTIVGGKSDKRVPNEPELVNPSTGKKGKLLFPNIFKDNLGEGLFPYVNFVPVRIAERVVLTVNFEANSEFDVYEAVVLACSGGNGRQKADVITMSMGGEVINKKKLRDASELAYENGVIFVCAAGNHKLVDRVFNVVIPAAFKETVAVAAIEPRLHKGTNEIRYYPWERGCDGEQVDISAPGKYIYTAYLDNGLAQAGAYKFGGATSQATAHVAAAAALWCHHFRDKLKDPWYIGQKENLHRKVDAFKWGLSSSMDIPPYWEDPSLDDNPNRKLKKAYTNNKGILNASELIKEKYSPEVYKQIKLNEAKDSLT